jgi:FkbM family methyltransferase
MIKEFGDIYRKFADRKSKELWQLAIYANLINQKTSFFKILIEREPLKEKRIWEYKQDLILFGCGTFSEFHLNYFKNSVSNVKILGFCDNFFEEKQHLGYKLIPLKELRELKDKIVMITIRDDKFINQIKEQLLNYGFRAEQILDYHYYAKDKRILKYIDSYNMQYFDKKIVQPKDYGVYLDCGAGGQNMIEKFMQFSKNKFQRIIAFEPDKIRFKKLKHDTMWYDKVECLNMGVYSCKKTFFWKNQNTGAARFCKEETKIKVEANSIDNVLKGKKATFIKMDIEGTELEALKGAKNTITKYKPTLAISIYHKINDLVDIPAYIGELVPSYKFYLRCYDMIGWEIMLYAVPN